MSLRTSEKKVQNENDQQVVSINSESDNLKQNALATWLNHARGTLIGNCVGDAIGLLTEFMAPQEAKEYYQKYAGCLEVQHRISDGHRERWALGDWTDDTDQMILIMQSLTKHKEADVVDFAKRLKHWAEHGFPELGDLGGCGIGNTTLGVLRHKSFPKDPIEASTNVWETFFQKQAAPNGGVMRTSVLGIFDHLNEEAVIKNSTRMCMVTHADPRCQASCVAVTTAISQMLQHFIKQESNDMIASEKLDEIISHSLKQAIDVLVKASSEFKINEELISKHKNELEQAVNVRYLEELKLSEHNKIGYTYKTLGAGFWALKQNDFRSAIEAITMEAGDADTNCAVAGALLGCKLGLSGIPKSWLNDVGTQNLHPERSTVTPHNWLRPQIDRFLKLEKPEASLPWPEINSFLKNSNKPNSAKCSLL